MKRLLGALGLFLFTALGLAAATIGEAAPALQLSEYLKGKPVKTGDWSGKKLLVVHFWGTACPPCEDALPVLNQLAGKYAKQAVFVAVGCDTPKAIREYARLNDFKFPVAADDVVKSSDAFLRSYDRLPTEVVIDRDGKLLWRGSYRQLDGVLGEITDGKYDLAAARELEEFTAALLAANTLKNYDKCLELIDARLKKFPDNPELVQGRSAVLANNLNAPEKALADLEPVIARNPKNYIFYDLKLNLLSRIPNSGRAEHNTYAVIARECRDQPQLLLHLSNQLTKNMVSKEYSLKSAYLLARAAYTGDKLDSKDLRGQAASVMGRCYYHLGMLPQALKCQKEAFALLKGSRHEEQSRLELAFINNVIITAREIEKMEAGNP